MSGQLYIVMIILALAAKGGGKNHFTALCQNYAKLKGHTDCWVCAEIPHHGESRIPLTVIPLTKEEVYNVQQFDSGSNNTKWRSDRSNYNFAGWFPRPATKTLGVIDGFRVSPPKGAVNTTCFCNQNDTALFQLGNSSCVHTSQTTPTTIPQVLNGTYWVGGLKAYPFIPGEKYVWSGRCNGNGCWDHPVQTLSQNQKGWSGCCYLAYIIPHLLLKRAPKIPWNKQGGRRVIRNVTKGDRLLWTLIPMYGTTRAGVEIQKLAASLEELANNTADVLAETQTQVAAITTEMIATRPTTLQNRMALDYILADKGGTCALIGEECCMYIPEVATNITDISKHVRDKIAKIREAGNQYRNEEGWEWVNWGLTGWGR
ncbi:syncytin-1-like [Chiloscyllium plagiosum]|uniref:syncytin-1-like n=1 Tax=Chiloscyllium plagiosum TaxID=36176 RepID=UPI001CB813D9|nr:syncytin-1-like [Chiloscyllium plagiosum]